PVRAPTSPLLPYTTLSDLPRIDTVMQIGYRTALWIGIAQMFSLIPGVSRSGASIMGALLAGVGRPAAAEFSFLLAIPVMFAATGDRKSTRLNSSHEWISYA